MSFDDDFDAIVAALLDEEATPGLAHFGGVSWWAAAVPRPWHRCRPQTTGIFKSKRVARCGCGAIRFGDCGQWIGRNSRS